MQGALAQINHTTTMPPFWEALSSVKMIKATQDLKTKGKNLNRDKWKSEHLIFIKLNLV